MKKREGHFEEEKCVQCGSPDLGKIADNQFKCGYCGCVFQYVVPKVFIKKGANVVFGRNVSIRGGVEIEEGANVNFKGSVEILEDGIEIK